MRNPENIGHIVLETVQQLIHSPAGISPLSALSLSFHNVFYISGKNFMKRSNLHIFEFFLGHNNTPCFGILM